MGVTGNSSSLHTYSGKLKTLAHMYVRFQGIYNQVIEVRHILRPCFMTSMSSSFLVLIPYLT